MVSNPGTLVIRADASVAIGTGHVMRCLALGQAWQDAGGEVTFALAQTTPAIEDRLRAERFEVLPIGVASGQKDCAQLIELAGARSAPWVVVDGYHFDSSYQQALKDAGLRILLVDDCGQASQYIADLVLNQNAYAREELYPRREAYTRLLLGARFAMLRREFAAWRGWQRDIAPVANKLLVTLGGSDPDNITLEVINALGLLNHDLEIVVVVGGSNPHFRSLEQAAANSKSKLRLATDISMPEVMAWADAAISGAGTTSTEICFMALPSILIDIAPNQASVARELSGLGAAMHVEVSEARVPEEMAGRVSDLLFAQSRAAISKAARTLVDGLGAERVISAIGADEVRLRVADKSDGKRLWEWANEPATRAASFRPEFIPWERHVEWFNSQLCDRQSRIYVALDSRENAIGAARFHLEGGRAVVSISVDSKARGKGYGTSILLMAVRELFQSSQAVAVDAYVKKDNEASQKLFESAGFCRLQGFEIMHGHESVHFVLANNGAH